LETIIYEKLRFFPIKYQAPYQMFDNNYHLQMIIVML